GVGTIAAAAGTGSLLASNANRLDAAPEVLESKKDSRKIRIGIVGGGFGTSFFWHLHPQCVVGAVSDLRPERLKLLQDTYHCDTTYPSLSDVVKDKTLDAVAVFTEAPNHARHVLEVLNNGKHCICAVPAAMN